MTEISCSTYYALKGLFVAHEKLVEQANIIEETAAKFCEDARLELENDEVFDFMWTDSGFDKLMEKIDAEVVEDDE